jgi:hypothetical protein
VPPGPRAGRHRARLLQPLLTRRASAAMLNQRIDVTTIAFAVAVVSTVALGRRIPVACA